MPVLDKLQGERLRQAFRDRLEAGNSTETIAESRVKARECLGLVQTDLGVGAIHDGVPIHPVGETGAPAATVDVVEPSGAGPHPVVVYIHGGGFCVNRSRDYRNVAFRFAQAGFVVFNVDYRLAPEAPFPAAFDDCVAAVRWVAANAHLYDGDPSRLAVAGDSAGANLCAAVAVHLAEQAPTISAAVLLYGIYDNKSMLAGPNGELWRATLDRYLGPALDELLDDPRVSPASQAHRLPPSLVLVGADDALCFEQSADLAAELEATGGPHEYVAVPGLPHGFISFDAMYPEARDVMKQIATFLNHHLT